MCKEWAIFIPTLIILFIPIFYQQTKEENIFVLNKENMICINGTKRLHSKQRDIIHDAYVAYIHVCVNYTISMLLN